MAESPSTCASPTATPIRLIGPAAWDALAPTLSEPVRIMAARVKFTAAAGQQLLVSGADARLAEVYFGVGPTWPAGVMLLRGLAAKLPGGDYRLVESPAGADPAAMALAWRLGVYRFERYRRTSEGPPARLTGLSPAAETEAAILADACDLARDMVNTPANDMGPERIEEIARDLAGAHAANITVVQGEALLSAGYPLVHAVGRAAVAARAPRMIEMTWGDPRHPGIALIGKGVAFDSGGLDIKPSAGMRLMKKDMGGAAHAISLAKMIMSEGLRVRLHLLIPAVENAIAGDAMRPGDIVSARDGTSVEIGNTDAEGRLILADALVRAGELAPVLTIDLATLTGAARVALGPEVVPFYTNDDGLAVQLAAASGAVDDPLWRMPLWQGYDAGLDSDIADIKNDPDSWVQAGSVAAALFLKRFAPAGAWLHCDLFAWNPRHRPGWPTGAEVQAIRAIHAVLKARYH